MNSIIKFIGLAALMFVATSVTSCNKDDDNGGSTSALVGSWTSVSATGTITYSSSSLSNAVNVKMTTYDLTDMAILDFDKEGKVRYADMRFLYRMYDYALKGDMLTFTHYDGYNKDFYKVTLNGDEFTLTHGDIFVGDIQTLIAYNLADMELKANGQGGVQEAGIGVSAINLTVKFKKQ